VFAAASQSQAQSNTSGVKHNVPTRPAPAAVDKNKTNVGHRTVIDDKPGWQQGKKNGNNSVAPVKPKPAPKKHT